MYVCVCVCVCVCVAAELIIKKLGRLEALRKQSVPEVVFAYFHNKYGQVSYAYHTACKQPWGETHAFTGLIIERCLS